MRRGQVPREQHGPGESFTKQELLDAGGISGKTFDMIRKAARIKGPPHGGLDWEFSREDIRALIHRAESGRFTERGGPAAQGWKRLLAGNEEGGAGGALHGGRGSLR